MASRWHHPRKSPYWLGDHPSRGTGDVPATGPNKRSLDGPRGLERPTRISIALNNPFPWNRRVSTRSTHCPADEKPVCATPSDVSLLNDSPVLPQRVHEINW